LQQEEVLYMFKWKNGWRNWLTFGVTVFIAYIITFAIVLVIKNNIGLNTSDTLSLTQLVLSMLLLPTVLVGFIITIQAFRESQELPDLDLFLELETGIYKKSLEFNSSEIFKRRKEWSENNPPSIQTEKSFSLVIQNKGNAIALWYTISINIQFGAIPQAYLDWTQFYQTRGAEHWQRNQTELEPNMRFEAMFMSNGTLASYPNFPFTICKMNTGWFLEEKSPKKEDQISYTIVTDRGHKKQGSLKLTFLAAPT